MKSSRSRFREFREKIRKGLLEPERYRDPNDKREERPYTGGGRFGPTATQHVFTRNKRQLFHEYRVMLKGYYGPLFLLLGVVVVNTCVAMITPFALKFLIDYVGKHKPLSAIPDVEGTWLQQWLPHTPMASLNFIVLVLIGAMLAGVVLQWIRLLGRQRLEYRLAGTLRQRLMNHLSKLSLAQLSDYKTGGIVSRIMGDSDQVVGGIQNAILNPFDALLRLIAVLVVLVAIDWKLSVVILLMIPPILFIHMVLFRRLRPMWRNIRDDQAMLSARLTDLFAGIRVVRSFRRERYEAKEYGANQHTMIRKQQHTAVLGRLLQTGWSIFGPGMGIVIVWYGGTRVLAGELEIGDLMLFQTAIFQLIGPITHTIESMQHLQQNLGALDRVVNVLDQPLDMPDRTGARPVFTTHGHIELRDVTFGYKAEQAVLRNVTLDVPAGAMVAIVGPSGSGKTTLVNLVARFFDVNQGAILLDGRDIRDITRESYRGLFAMVLQDVYLFDGTVAQNIAYGRRNATREEIIGAAKQANAHEFIVQMENGYDTIIGERGGRLSGGQKQRLSIARAILANPRILVLDEATSSLDTHSEHLIQASLNELMEDRTTLVIAHRLSTIMHADKIVVLVDGQIVEQGTHEELLERGGTYHAMFTQQFQRHRDPTLERIEWEAAQAGSGEERV